MEAIETSQREWVEIKEVNLDKVSRFSKMDIFASILILGIAFSLVAPMLI